MRLLTLMLLASQGCGGDPAPAKGANVLLVTLDTVRADHVGAYGYAEARTPTALHVWKPPITQR